MKRRQRKGQMPTSRESDSSNPADFEICDGVEAYIDACGTSPTGMNFKGKAELSGNYEHHPGRDGRNRVVINRMVTGPGASAVEPPNASVSAAAGRSSAGFSDLPGKLCSCGFAAFDWQLACPRCSRELK